MHAYFDLPLSGSGNFWGRELKLAVFRASRGADRQLRPRL